MSLIVPNVAKNDFLTFLLEEDLTLRLYSNDKTPAATDTAASYTEVAGGGYSPVTLSSDDWTITEASPSVATQPFRNFGFTGPTTAPGTVYGYYLTNLSGVIRWAERFEEGVLPFEPEAGSLIRVTPRIDLAQG